MVITNRVLRVVTLLMLISLSPFIAFAECIKPDIQTILTSLTDADYFPGLEGTFTAAVSEGTTQYQWLQASWDGPPSGMLAALTCDGEVLEGVQIGAIKKMQPLTIDGLNAPVVRAEYLAGIGTSGYRHTKIGVFAILNRHIVELWGHDLYFRDFQICEESYEIQYAIKMSPDSSRITVSGIRKTTSGTPQGIECIQVSETRKALPVEEYCWVAEGTFKKCTQ